MPNFSRELSFLAIGKRVRPSGRLWNPPADVYRSGNGWIIKVDLAGVRSDDFGIQINGDRLRLAGCRRDTLYREGFVYQQMEITYSKFEKTLQFPCHIEGASMEYDYSDGFLIIKLNCE